MHGTRQKCSSGAPRATVANELECQRKAEAARHAYFSYLPPQRWCFTSAQCKPKATQWEWKIYKAPDGTLYNEHGAVASKPCFANGCANSV